MDIRINPPRQEWPELCRRPSDVNPVVRERVEAIVGRVREGGDEALKALAAEIDGFVPERFEVSAEEIREASELVPKEVKDAIAAAAANIRAFHEAQTSLSPTDSRNSSGTFRSTSSGFVITSS